MKTLQKARILWTCTEILVGDHFFIIDIVTTRGDNNKLQNIQVEFVGIIIKVNNNKPDSKEVEEVIANSRLTNLDFG